MFAVLLLRDFQDKIEHQEWESCKGSTDPSCCCACRCWSSGSPSRARAAPLRPACRLLLSPTAPPSQHTIFTGPQSLTLPPRPWPWQSQIHMTFMRSPGLSLRVGVSTRANTAGENTLLSRNKAGQIPQGKAEE